jgi:hypothetical protein
MFKNLRDLHKLLHHTAGVLELLIGPPPPVAHNAEELMFGL